MMHQPNPALTIEVAQARHLTAASHQALVALCHRAYGEDLAGLFLSYVNPTHALDYRGKTLVSHALWVTRWLSAGEGPLLRTAYVEMVATDPDWQGQGFASAVMERVAREIDGYDLAALWPNYPEWYARLGWVSWPGPLFIRTANGLRPTPDDRIMIRYLPGTPALDRAGPLSAEWREGELW